MNSKRLQRYALTLGVLAFSSANAVQLQYCSRSSEGSDCLPSTKIYVQDGKVRIDDGIQPAVFTVYDTADNSVTIINRKDRKYMVMDEKSMRSISSQVEAIKKEMEAQFKNMPPEQVAQIKQMMGMTDKKAPTITTEKTGKTKKVAGFRCEELAIKEDGKANHHYCIAQPKILGVTKAEYKTLSAMLSAMQKLAEQTGMGNAMTPLDPSKLGGMPIRMHNHKLKNRQIQELQSVSQKRLDAGAFNVPDGFAKEKMDLR